MGFRKSRIQIANKDSARSLHIPCGKKFLREFIFASDDFLCFVGTDICDLDRVVFLANFCDFQKVAFNGLITFSFFIEHAESKYRFLKNTMRFVRIKNRLR